MRTASLLPLLLLTLSACTERRGAGAETTADSALAAVDTLRWDSVTLHARRELYDCAEPPSYRVDARVARAQGGPAARAINEAVAQLLFGRRDTSLSEALAQYADSVARGFEEDIAALYEPGDGTGADCLHFELSVEGSALDDSRPGVVAYMGQVYEYEGGAHGALRTLCANFDARTGQLLTRDSVFLPGKEDELRALIERQLVRDWSAKSLDELREATGITMLGDVYVGEDNFLLTRRGARFIFNEYEIAPYSAGTVKATVGYQDLEPCLRPGALRRAHPAH